ncbi:hypothetical protein Halru_0614 [Halovivax ruber XH-70]|uniref:Uncharacterized protein n=1 Tax=Halovivax ruber (strain DSM 18193 / JCM 13892 / XH-70) TaxID=797302 RepID=L0IAH3_HALRX|nr:hypothetical protein [Halovivax ruber]AGB15241.1 hypothetical protein Halru_0614 [Halovivax ruber XH-70]
MNLSKRLPWADGAGRRVLLVLAVVAMVVASAGCLSMLSDEEGADSSKQTAKVPAEADMLVNVDMAIFGDEETTALLDGLGEETDSSAAEMEELYTEFRNETGLDLADLEQTTMFGMTDTEAASESEFAVLIDADWDTETLIDALNEDAETTLEQTEYAGEDVLWKPANPDATSDPVYVGEHDDGQYVIGTKAAVTASLDVSYEGAEPVSGTLLETFEDTTEGLVTFAMDVPETADQGDDFGGAAPTESVETITGAYTTSDGNASIEIRMAFGDAEQAENLEGTINFMLSQSTSDMTETEQQLVANLDTETDGSTLVVTWDASVDTLIELANEQ